MAKRKEHSPEEYVMMVAMRLEVVANRYVFTPMRMSFASVKILGYLACAGPATPTGILESVGGTKSNVSQRLDKLEKEGFVSRRSETEGDRRKVLIRVTPRGLASLKEVKKRLAKARRAMNACFSKDEIEANAAFCEKMIAILKSPEEDLERIFGKKSN